MRNLRVAFCFSGQLRTWKHCYSSWLNFASKFETPPDIFCHMWDFNSNTGIVKLIKKDSNIEKVSNDEINEFLDIMKPKKHVVETFEKSQVIEKSMNNEMQKHKKVDKTMYWISNHFYSNMYSAFIKRDYEIENGCETNNPLSHCLKCSYKELIPILQKIKN
jgi:hypothetical protein